jgi:hypothetical protein
MKHVTRTSAEAAHVEEILRAAKVGPHDPDARLTVLLADLDGASAEGSDLDLAGTVRMLINDSDVG